MNPEPKSYVEREAHLSGRSKRSISRDIKVAEGGVPALQAAVEAATVKITDAERIAGLPAEQQEIEIEKITRRKEQTQRDETAPAPSSTESAVTQPVSSPVVLIEVVLKAALQFQESIKNGQITESVRVLEVVQQVRNILNEVTLAVRTKYPMKTAGMV